MFKFLVVPLNLMFIFLLNAILSEDVKIEQQFPNSIAALGECDVTVTFEKGSIIGFAKYVQPLPKGVVVESIETAGSSFTFAQGSAKFIWMNVPKEEKFSLKFKIKATDPYLDKIELGGTFTYLDKNKRMTYTAEKRSLVVGVEPTTPEKTEEQEPAASAAESSLTERSINSLGGDNYEVNITINKPEISGFAKIQDFIPSGAKVSSDNKNGAVFTQVDKKAKFVWMELPSDESFMISYNLDLSAASDKDPSNVFGEFSYLKNGQTQKVKIEGVQAEGEEMMADGGDSEQDDTDDVEYVEEPEPVVKKTRPRKTRKQRVQEKITPRVPTTVDGIIYRVQILAGHKNVGAGYFNENHSYTGQFFTENHEGWVKYTTGEHGVYRQARDSRESINSQYNFPGPFVVAYNDGDRITVQEALMITNQKWLK